jgi:hypothetical protein
MGKTEVVIEILRKEFPGACVIPYNSKSKSLAPAGGAGAPDAGSVSSDDDSEDINDTLKNAPEQHTFIVIKNMFYAAKTLNDAYVGVLWDRLGKKDDTNLQSLLGRACGYGKNKRTIIYASQSTTENYILFWRELCSSVKAEPIIGDMTASELRGKMPGVAAHRAATGGGTCLSSSVTAAAPMSVAATASSRASNTACESHLEEFLSMDSLNERWSELYYEKNGIKPPHSQRTPRQNDGVYVCSIGGKSEIQKAKDIRIFAVGTRSWGSGLTTAAPGDLVARVLVGYEDDGTLKFFLRWTIK